MPMGSGSPMSMSTRPPMSMGSGSPMSMGSRPPMSMGRGPMIGSSGTAGEEVEPPDYVLFRFFDFTVQPGKHYRYRVRIVIRNPSYGVPGSYLAEDSMGKKKVLENKDAWSEPTEPVAVPLDSQVLAASAKESQHWAAGHGDDHQLQPRGRGCGCRRVPQPAAGKDAELRQSASEDTARRQFPRNGWNERNEWNGYNDDGGERKKREETEAKPATVDFVTDCLLLDITGGGKLAGKERKSLTEPANFLLLDKDGVLIVHNELDYLPERQRHAPPPAPANTGS